MSKPKTKKKKKHSGNKSLSKRLRLLARRRKTRRLLKKKKMANLKTMAQIRLVITNMENKRAKEMKKTKSNMKCSLTFKILGRLLKTRIRTCLVTSSR